MARHFLGLYLLIVFTLAIVSWGQDKFLQAYSGTEAAEDRPVVIAMASLADRLHGVPPEQWRQIVTRVGASTGTDMELFKTGDIAVAETLAKLQRGEIAYMEGDDGDWALRRLDDAHVLAITSVEPAGQRGWLEWTLTMLFYATIALV